MVGREQRCLAALGKQASLVRAQALTDPAATGMGDPVDAMTTVHAMARMLVQDTHGP